MSKTVVWSTFVKMETPNHGSFKKMPEVVVTEQNIDANRDDPMDDTQIDTWVPGAKKKSELQCKSNRS